MIAALGPDEFADRGKRFRIAAGNPHLPAAWQVGVAVLDDFLLCAHYGGARHLAQVHEFGRRKIARLKRMLDQFQMRADLRHRQRVIPLHFQRDAATVGSNVESVR